MKKFYLLFAMFLTFAISFNTQAQETVIAVWDFADNSVAGEIHPDFAGALNPDLTYLEGGGSGANVFTNTDETGAGLDMSYTMSTTSPNASAWSNFVLNNLHLGPTDGTPTAGSGLVDNKIHFSVSFKEITITQGSGDKVTFILKDANQGTGTNWRQTGLQIAENANNNTTLKASAMVINGGQANGTLKLAGHFGPTQGYTLTDLTIGVTIDYTAGTTRFWIDSPDAYTSGDGNAWGFKMYNADGWANTSGWPALTSTPAAGAGLANSVTQMMQFSPVFQDPGSKMVVDQIKISTGTYENTVEAGNVSPVTSIDSFPYCEDFETPDADNLNLPTGWGNFAVDGSVSGFGWQGYGTDASGNVPMNGTNGALFYVGSYDGDQGLLVTPALNTTGLTNPQLTYSYANVDWLGDLNQLDVYYRTSVDGAWTLLQSHTEANAALVTTSVTLPESSDDFYIGFVSTANYGYGTMVDDVCVAETPTVPAADWDVTVGDPTTGIFTDEAVISVVSVDNFVVGDGSDASHDGHWHHEVTDATGAVVASGMNYDGNPVVVVNLTTGDYSARMFLVDNTHQELDPVVEEIITFSVTNAPECGETLSYCYDSDGSSLYTNENPMVLFSQTAGDVDGDTVQDEISVTFAGGVEEDYDFVIVMNGAGVQIGDPLTGDLAGVTVTSDDGTITVGINPDTSWSCVSGQSGFASLDMTVNCAGLSLTDQDISDTRIYPNPVDGNYITIQSPIVGDKYVEIFDINGRRVLDTSINSDTLDVSSINSGFYMIKVTINGQAKISKLVVR